MVSIENENITFTDNKFKATCVCGATNSYTAKDTALKMLERKSCKKCKNDYRNSKDTIAIFKEGGKWGKFCSGCGTKQLYTRKNHAAQSYINDWKCKKCNIKQRNNTHVGDKQRLFNQFYRSSKNRNIPWSISIDEMFEKYTGYCALTGWELNMSYKNTTASLDRIENDKGYEPGNIQWVHTMLNMCKNKYNQSDFLIMCQAISNNLSTSN